MRLIIALFVQIQNIYFIMVSVLIFAPCKLRSRTVMFVRIALLIVGLALKLRIIAQVAKMENLSIKEIALVNARRDMSQ